MCIVIVPILAKKICGKTTDYESDEIEHLISPNGSPKVHTLRQNTLNLVSCCKYILCLLVIIFVILALYDSDSQIVPVSDIMLLPPCGKSRKGLSYTLYGSER